MISMNDKINVKMTLFEANLLRSMLFIEKFENKTDTSTSVIEKLLTRVDESLNALDFSENEKYVDEYNKKIKKEIK